MIFKHYTDLHLDHLTPESLEHFLYEDFGSGAMVYDGIFVTGDISTSMWYDTGGYPRITKLEYHLQRLEDAWPGPIYFVLGNHDMWSKDLSMNEIRHRVRELCRGTNLVYLTSEDAVCLDWEQKVFLIGHDGWYDMRGGRGMDSRVELVDRQAVKDLNACYDRWHMMRKCQELADRATDHIERQFDSACDQGARQFVVLTHVPPFENTHYHEGKIGDDEHQPWFVNKRLGQVLSGMAGCEEIGPMTILCGHTHGHYDGLPLPTVYPNLRVMVGGAEYGKPAKAGELEIEYKE